MQDIFNNIINILLVLGGFTAFLIYYFQCKAKRRDAAALIVTQIEELKEKMLQINNISIDNTINEKAFYETLDIITENQWEKYKHLFIKKMDSNSFKTINNFYESVLSVREQLVFVKQLQRQQYFNIQGMLDTNCNSFIMDTLNFSLSSTGIKDYKQSIIEKETKNEAEEKQKELMLKVLDDLMKANPNFDANQFWKIYNMKRDLLKTIVNSSPYISYVPLQVSETFNKAIKNISSIEVIGCEGFRKLKKIAKIK